MSDDPTSNKGSSFRQAIGLLCVIGSLLAFTGLYFIEIPKANEQALLLALGYLFGWGSAVVQSEYGSTATGRKVAESAIRNMDKNPSGTADDPLSVAGADAGQKPVDTKITGEK